MSKISFDFKNRTAVVTGGAQGFGLDIAKRFLNSGANVVIWDIDNKMIEKSLKDLNNPNLSSNIVDVSNHKEVENCINKILKNSDIDILINNQKNQNMGVFCPHIQRKEQSKNKKVEKSAENKEKKMDYMLDLYTNWW